MTSVAMLFCFPVQNFTEIGLSAAELWPKTIFITAAVLTVKHILVDCVDLMMYEINTLLFLPLKIHLIIFKHIKSLILLKKLVFISNFNVFMLMFVICFFYSSLIALIVHS